MIVLCVCVECGAAKIQDCFIHHHKETSFRKTPVSSFPKLFLTSGKRLHTVSHQKLDGVKAMNSDHFGKIDFFERAQATYERGENLRIAALYSCIPRSFFLFYCIWDANNNF